MVARDRKIIHRRKQFPVAEQYCQREMLAIERAEVLLDLKSIDLVNYISHQHHQRAFSTVFLQIETGCVVAGFHKVGLLIE